jgi:hypothetical protein
VSSAGTKLAAGLIYADGQWISFEKLCSSRKQNRDDRRREDQKRAAIAMPTPNAPSAVDHDRRDQTEDTRPATTTTLEQA